MSWWKYFTRARRDADFEQEIEAHLAHETDGFVAAGLSADAARQAALRKVGNVAALRESVHERNTLSVAEGYWQDLRHAIRQLRFSPGFAAVVILSLALGAGVNTAMFQLLDAVRLRSLPVAKPNQLAELSIPKPRNRTGNFTGWPSEFTNAMWEQIRDRQQGFSGMLAWSMDQFNLAPSGEAHLVQGLWASGDFFRVLGVEPLLGRTFTAAEDNRACNTGAVLSFAFWQREFGGDPTVVGREISINTVRFPVLGVAPRSFFGLDAGRSFDVALPLCAERLADGGNGRIDSGIEYWLGIMGRIRPRWSLETARAQLRAIASGIFAATLPSKYDANNARNYLALRLTADTAATGQSEFRRSYEAPLWLLLGASALVLLIACANLASITLARASAREREIAVRLAIGASRGRIVRQLLIENLVLATIGCTAGLLLGSFMSRTLTRFLGGGVFLDLSLDWRVALFAAGLAAISCLLFGLAPGLRAARMARSLAGAAGGRIAGGTRQGVATRRGLAVSQIALSLVLVTAALVCVGGLRQLLTQDPGFRADGVVVAMADISGAKMPPEEHRAYFLRMLDRIQASNGVIAASSVAVVPIGGGTWNTPVAVDDAASGHAMEGESYMNEVSPGYFRAMRTPLIAGRNFAVTDDLHATKVAIVSQDFVRTFFHGENPLGRRFHRTGGLAGGEIEIVGVAADSKYASLRSEPHPAAYLNAAQDADWDTETAFVVRANGPLANAVDAVKQAGRDLEPRPILRIETLQQKIDNSLRLEQLMATLSGLYGALAALLAAIGVYGALSYLVARRKNEIGVRVALGASRGAVVRMILRETAVLAAAGLAIGSALTLAGTQAAANLIFGAKALGAPSLIVASLALASLALLASLLPACRAAAIDPAAALRQE